MLSSNESSLFLRTSHLIYVYLIFIAFSGAAIPFGSLHIKFDWLGAAIICAAGTAQILNGSRINKTVLIYVVLFTSWLVINGMVAALMAQFPYNIRGFSSYFLQFILAFLTFLMISSMDVRTSIAHKLIAFWVIIACTASLLAVVQILVGDIIVDKFLYIPYYDEATISTKVIAGILAPTAWFPEASWLGSFLVVPTMYVILEMFKERRLSESRVLYCVAAFILVLGLFLSYSLTAILSVLIGILAILFLSPRVRLPMVLLVLIGATLVFAFANTERVALQISRFSELFASLVDFSPGDQIYGTATSFYVRSVGFYEGLSAFAEKPIAGIGIGQGERPFDSGFITLLAEQGIFGTVLYFVPLMLIISRLNRIRRYGEREMRHLAAFFIIALVADYVNGLVTHHSFHLQRWLLISIAFSWVYSLSRWSSFEGQASKDKTAYIAYQIANGKMLGPLRSRKS